MTKALQYLPLLELNDGGGCRDAKKAEIYPEYISNVERIGSSGFTLKGGQTIHSDRLGQGVEINEEALAAIATDYRTNRLTPQPLATVQGS